MDSVANKEDKVYTYIN